MKGLRILAWAMVCAMVLVGCSSNGNEEPTERHVVGNTEIMPENVLQLGESFTFDKFLGEGTLECKVTKAWLVEEESQCPAEESFCLTGLLAFPGGINSASTYHYNEWFTEGGAFDLGARVLMVEISVTNVDAEGWLDNGIYEGDFGFFANPYLFYAYCPITAVDLTELWGEGEHESFRDMGQCIYFSEMGEYSQDDLDTMGNEEMAIEIKPGETVTYTLGFGVDGDTEGQAMDFSKVWVAVSGTLEVDDGIFIDTKLG